MSVTQFISRVERPGRANAFSESVPGPGAYNDPRLLGKPFLPSFAPFSGTSKRQIMVVDGLKNAPAPGSYELEQNIIPPSSSTASVFRSKARRFEEVPESSQGPGPGAYVFGSTLNTGKKRAKVPVRSLSASNELLELLKEVSVSTRAPSIPTKAQSYGYELGESGKMILQECAIPGFRGTKGDTVGPGDYNPDTAYTLKNKTWSSFTNAERSLMTVPRDPSTSPGPGTYNQLSTFDAFIGRRSSYKADFVVRMNEIKSRQSATFESKSLRDPFGDTIKHKILPGPGEYDLNGYLPPRPTEHSKHLVQSFASTAERFPEQRTRANRLYTSPGDYDPLTSDFEQSKLRILKQKRMVCRSEWASDIAFAATEKRFNEVTNGQNRDSLGDNGPDPGSYNPMTNMKDAMRMRSSARTAAAGSFGSHADRFQNMKSDAEVRARGVRNGDAVSLALATSLMNHNTSSGIASKTKIKAKGALQKGGKGFGGTGPFVSKLDRFQQNNNPEEAGPPPGRYDTSLSWKAPSVAMSNIVGVSRKIPDVDTPGPGHYPNAHPKLGDGKKNRRDIFINTSQRTQLVPKNRSDGPGPGEYCTSTSMLKPSHNIHLSCG